MRPYLCDGGSHQAMAFFVVLPLMHDTMPNHGDKKLFAGFASHVRR